jgi:type IV pilus assembly protein PilC
MDYAYIAYTKEKKLVKGKVSAVNENEATAILKQGGYQVVNLRAESSYFDMEKLWTRFSNVGIRDVLLLSRQLALLIQSGIDIVTSLELLRNQMTNPVLKTAVTDIFQISQYLPADVLTGDCRRRTGRQTGIHSEANGRFHGKDD